MDKCRMVLKVAKINFLQWKKNPRIVLSFLLAGVLCMMLCGKILDFISVYHTTVQAFEPFIWVFGDPESIMISSLLLILLFADMPFIHGETPYILLRCSRKIWLAGQLLYVMLTTLLYTSFTLVITCLLTVPYAFAGNKWSETGAMLGYSGVGGQIALPASVKAMETTRPFRCALIIFGLMLLYALLLAVLMMIFNLLGGRFLGVLSAIAVNLYGFFLNPGFFMELFSLPQSVAYKANVAAGWLSPLNHATYYMHNFGYDRLPRIWMSVCLFLGLLVILILIGVYQAGKYEFHFVQTKE